jgi:hypothetical protein
MRSKKRKLFRWTPFGIGISFRSTMLKVKTKVFKRTLFRWIPFCIGISLGSTMVNVQAKEFKLNDTEPTCSAEQVVNQDNLNPSAKTVQVGRKNQLLNDNDDISKQDEDPCEAPETSEASKTPNEMVEEPEDREMPASENSERSSHPIDPFSDDPTISDKSDSNQPTISNQDSHDFKVYIQFGGASPGGDENLSTPEYSSPSETEVSSPEPLQTRPSPPNSLDRPAQTPHSPSKTKHHKQGHKTESHKQEQRSPKKLREHDQGVSREQRKRSDRKADDKRLKQKTHRTPTPRKRQEQTHQIKNHRKKLHAPHRHNINKPIGETHIRQGRFYPTHLKQRPHILRSRTPLHRQLRQQISPTRSLRRSVPRLPQIRRRH